MSVFNFLRAPEQTVPLTRSESAALERQAAHLQNKKHEPSGLGAMVGLVSAGSAVAFVSTFALAAGNIVSHQPVSDGADPILMRELAAAVIPPLGYALMKSSRRNKLDKIYRALDSGERPAGSFVGLGKVDEFRRTSLKLALA